MRQKSLLSILFLVVMTGIMVRSQNTLDLSGESMQLDCKSTFKKIILLQEIMQEQMKIFQNSGCLNYCESGDETNIVRPRNCQDIYKLGHRQSGVYDIYLDSDTNTTATVKVSVNIFYLNYMYIQLYLKSANIMDF